MSVKLNRRTSITGGQMVMAMMNMMMATNMMIMK